jgi:hypothetical protein
MPSLRSCAPAFITCLLVIPVYYGTGCGPFFTENMLDQPRGIAQLPAFDFISEFRKLKHPATSGLNPGSTAGSPAYTLELEMREMEGLVRSRITDEAARSAWLDDYRALRAGMLDSSDKSEFVMSSQERERVPQERRQAKAGQWPQELPDDVKAYLDGARSFSEGDLDAARGAWKRLLELPADQRHWRSTWAAWMLFRACEAGALGEQQHWLQETRRLAAEGAADCLHLGVEATYLLARVHEGDAPPVGFAEWQHAALARAVLGHSRSAEDVSDDAARMLSATGAEADSVIADEYLRRVLLLSLLRESTPSRMFYGDTAPKEGADHAWLDRCEKLEIHDQQEATLLAWAAYNMAQFDMARRWLKLAPGGDTKAQWLRGKLAAMRGDVAEAERLLKLAAKPALAQPHDEARDEMERDCLNNLHPLTDANYERVQRHYVLASLGAIQVANNHFTDALHAFERSDYWMDTAYVAERLVSVEELLIYARKQFPKAAAPQAKAPVGTEEPVSVNSLADRYGWGGITDHGDRFRCLTARRLAREHYFKDAREYFPEDLRRAFDHYVAAWRRGHDERADRPTRAAALWDAAQMHRVLGLPLFGYEGAPDFAAYGGAFELDDFAKLRAQSSWLSRWETKDATPEMRASAIPLLPASREELRLAARTAPKTDQRYQFRFAAADLAWEAASLMPDDDPHTADVLCIAGSWIKYRDPKAADRFYQAMVRRCPNVPLAQEADRRRWFPQVAWDYHPSLD